MAAVYKASAGQVEFKAKGFPSFITISGKSSSVMGSLDLSKELASGTFKLPLKSLKTGMDLRDDHMLNKYLEVGRFPEATLTLKPFKLQNSGVAKATLKLHNVEKDIDVQYESKKSADGIEVKTSFDLVLSDFNIAIPSFQGITVAKDIKLTVAFKAKK
jgi:polyisoprenoid-binding protein YceI